MNTKNHPNVNYVSVHILQSRMYNITMLYLLQQPHDTATGRAY